MRVMNIITQLPIMIKQSINKNESDEYHYSTTYNDKTINK